MARFRRNRFPRLARLAELEPGAVTLESAGAIAQALVEARQLGVATLDGWLISADVFRDAVRSELPPAHDPASLLRIIHRPAGLERAARARERLLGLPLTSTLGDELEVLWAKLGGKARWGLRVRASWTCADAGITELAGLDCQVLGVRGEHELADGIRKIWSSCFYADALRYLRGQKIRDIATAVLIEPLEPIAASGALLTEDPRQPARFVERGRGTAAGMPVEREPIRVASAALGLGSPVLDGSAANDLLRFSETGEIVEERVAAKTRRWVIGEGGPVLEAVSSDKARKLALKPKAIAELVDIAKRVAGAGPGTRKIDFLVLRGGGVRVSDVRPLVSTAALEGATATTVWSRVGLGESLPGVPTPLTGSLAESFEEEGLRHALESLGCKLPRGASLVRRVSGRYYVNLSVIVPTLSAIPGIDGRSLIDLVAFGDTAGLELELKLGARASSLSRLPIIAGRLLTQQRRLTEDVQRFEREAEQQRRWLAEMDLAILPDDALKTTLLETRGFLQRTGQLLLRSSLVVIAAHIGLATVLGRSSPVLAARLTQIVTSGVGDLDSAALGIALAHVTAIADKDPAARELLRSCAVRSPNDLPAGPARRALGQFLDAYGERAVREAELWVPRFSEDPQPVLAMIAAGLSGQLVDPDQRLSIARVQADRELAALEARIPYVEKVLMRALVARARVFIRLRERLRVWMARTLRMLRVVTLDVDRRLRRLDASLTPGAAFFCTFEELVSAVGSYRADLGPLVRLRRESYERDAARVDPPDTFTGSPAVLSLPPVGSVVLHGKSGGSGVVTGRARLVGSRALDAASLRPGEILVTRSPDIGLAPLFLVAQGLVCELGNALSHGAVIAREYGLPAVVGVQAATTTIQNGERLRVDGDRGVVERLDA